MTTIPTPPADAKPARQAAAPGDNRLPALAAEIQAEHQRCKANVLGAVEAAVAAGRSLIEARELVPHGQWQDWLRANVRDVSVRTAQRYMRAAEKAKNDTVSFLSLRELIRPEPRKAAPERDWWWRRIPDDERAAWWKTYPNDLPHAVLALEEDGASREEIAAELLAPVETITRLCSGSAAEPPPYRHCSPRADGKDLEYWREEFEFGQRFEKLLGLMVRFYRAVWRGSLFQASWWAENAGRDDLARRLKRRDERKHAEMVDLHNKMIMVEPDGPSRAIAALIAADVVAGDAPDHISNLIVGLYANDFLALTEQERRVYAAIARAGDIAAELTADDLPKQLMIAAKAGEVVAHIVREQAHDRVEGGA